MSRRSLTLPVLAGLAIAMAAPVALRAQNITAPIRAARRAVQATNTHTAREQSPMTSARDTGRVSAKAERRAPNGGTTGDVVPNAAATKRGNAPATSSAAKNLAKPRGATSGAARSANDTASRIPHPAARAASAESQPPIPTLVRESFTYTADGRRDPFVSLMTSGELRPMISDLKVAAIIYDPTGHSVAVLRDLSTNEQYRVTVGKTLGRMRVTAIQPKSVTFVLEEFGYSRQEVLALNDSTTERAQ